MNPNELPPELLAQMMGQDPSMLPQQGLPPEMVAQADMGQLPPEMANMPPELLAQLQGQAQANPNAAMLEQQQQFKKAYDLGDDDFKAFGFHKLLKQSQTKQRKDKLTNWQKEPTVQELKYDFNAAQQSQSAYISELNKWQKLYDAPKWGDKNHKGSRINPKLIRKQAEWNAPALSEPFLSNSNLFDVKPLTFEDVKRAKQNALILNRQFNTQLDKVRLVDGVIRQLVKNGSCVLRLGWEYQTKEVEETIPIFTYTTAPMEAQEQLMAEYESYGQMRELEPDSYESLPEEVKAAFEMSEQKQQLFIAEKTGESTRTNKKVIKNQPTVQICNLKNVYIDPTCGNEMAKAQFVVHTYESSLSELKRQGIYENLGYLSQVEADNGGIERNEDTGFRFADKARRKLTVHEYWGNWDIDGSGQTTPIVAAWVGDTLIRMEENPFPNGKIPFVVFNYLPNDDSVYGIPNAELMGDNQDILGAVTRGMIDLLGKSANSQTGFSKNFLDSANKLKFARGQDYEYNQGFDPKVHIHTHKYPEIPNSAMTLVQMMNNEAESLSGVKAFSGTGISASNLGDVAAGVRGVLDAVSKREMSILRRVSQGFIDMGRFILAMNSEFLSEKEVVRITNEEFITIRRDDLAGEYDLTLTISTAEGDENKAQQLAFLMQTIGNSMGMGLTQMILSEIAHLRKMPELAKAIEQYEEQPDEMQMQLQELEMQKLQAEIELMKSQAAENMAKAGVHEAKVGVEEARAQSLQGDADNKVLDFVQRDSGTKHANEMDKQALINEGRLGQEAIKQDANLAMQQAGFDNQAASQDVAHNQALMQQMAAKELDAQYAPNEPVSSPAQG